MSHRLNPGQQTSATEVPYGHIPNYSCLLYATSGGADPLCGDDMYAA